MSDSSNRPLRLLLIDDNRDGVDTLAFLLREEGCEVVVGYNAFEAMTALKSFEPDACVIDINMPQMTGYELATAIRAGRQPVPVLATLTAYDDYQHLDRAVDAGFELHFTKPVEARELLDQILQAIKKHALRERKHDDTLVIIMPEGSPSKF